VTLSTLPGSQTVDQGNPGTSQWPVTLDSAEYEYTPGPLGAKVTAAGDNLVYTATAGKQFRVHWTYAINNPASSTYPFITIKILNSSGALVKTPFMVYAISKRQLFTGPVGGMIVVNLDIAGSVACSFIIEEF